MITVFLLYLQKLPVFLCLKAKSNFNFSAQVVSFVYFLNSQTQHVCMIHPVFFKTCFFRKKLKQVYLANIFLKQFGIFKVPHIIQIYLLPSGGDTKPTSKLIGETESTV